jgi:hypothetical protein
LDLSAALVFELQSLSFLEGRGGGCLQILVHLFLMLVIVDVFNSLIMFSLI